MKKILIFFIIISVLGILGVIFFYNISLKPVGVLDDNIEFKVEKGESLLSLAGRLKGEHLIRSKLAYRIYVKLNRVSSIEAGTYYLRENMNVPEIVETLSGKADNKTGTKITIKEGVNIRKIAKVIAENTKYTEQQFYDLIADRNYLESLIEEYWFLTDEIEQNGIYYPLEGYLYPDTYRVTDNETLDDILAMMLDEMDEHLTVYKKNIQDNVYTLHEILTMASIIEAEAPNNEDRAIVSSVFYNRLENGWALGSDVTTYYGLKVDMNERDLYASELAEYNNYNTRSSKMAGKLPISPICSPSIGSIEAALNPAQTDYFYFVADKNGKTYFSKNENEHNKIISTLKTEGLWYQYES